MANIVRQEFVNFYGIDDINFVAFLQFFDTFSKIVSMYNETVIPKNKMMHLYNRYIYYKSLGHDNKTITEEMLPYIRSEFFFDGNGTFEYKLPTKLNSISVNNSFVSISGKVCQIKFNFMVGQDINANSRLFDLSPAPFSPFEFYLPTVLGDAKNSLHITINSDGIITMDKILTNTIVSGSITYIFTK